jgi:tetratricopeptide (TPR) repeat protein
MKARRASRTKTLKRKPLKAVRRGKPSKAARRVVVVPKIRRVVEDPRVRQAREQYQQGVSYLTQHKYERAAGYFEKVLAGPVAELSERARVHMKICDQRLDRKPPALKTAEDHYNYAVSKINTGNLEVAEEHLTRALKMAPNAGHLHYARAALLSLRADVEGSLAGLKKSIELDVQNRYLARNDSDFNNLCEDPRFADLVYPEKGQEA